MRLTGSSLSSSLPRVRAARSASHGHGWTARLDPSRPHLKSCSRSEAMAPVMRVSGGGPGACRMSLERQLASCKQGSSKTLHIIASLPRFSLSGLKPRCSSMWCGDSSHGDLEDSMVQLRGVPVTLPASALHQPTRSDAGDATHFARMQLGELIDIDLFAPCSSITHVPLTYACLTWM